MSVFDDYLPWTHERAKAIGKDELSRLLQVRGDIPQDQSIPITHLMVLLYTKQHGFIDLNIFKNRSRLIDWFNSKGRSVYNLNSFDAVIQNSVSIASNKKPGVNLVGYSKGQLGLGEDLRTFSTVLEHLNIEYSVYQIGHPSDSPQEHGQLPESNDLPFSHSIFFLNVIELAKLLHCYTDFKSAFGYTIAVPPWELPLAPEEWQSTLIQFDEVWAMSEFVFEALRPVCTTLKYSAPVVLPTEKRKCELYGRQTRSFTFLYVFDASSFLSRKNPEAVIKAFLEAFPDKTTSVRLILKTTPFPSSLGYEKLMKLAASDSRISILTKRISDTELSDLWSQCDCYISLHRSEGFGRTIAEAITRRIPVITTNWSGNTDITGKSYELGVSYQLIDVGENEYPYSRNQIWAEPDCYDAADKMAWVFQNQSSETLADIIDRLHQRYSNNFSVTAKNRPIEELFDKHA